MMGSWWVWAVGALVLGAVEMLAPGFIFLGFAIGAGVIALLLLFGGPLAAWLIASPGLMLVGFAGLSLLAWVGLRFVFGSPGRSPKTFDHDIND